MPWEIPISLASPSRSDAPNVAHDEVALLRLEGVAKRFGETDAVKALSMDIREGEFLTLLGPSGCGKTTLLRMIGGFEQPTQGRLLLRGTDLTRVPPERRPFNMVFQSYALFPHMTVAENVGYGPRMRSGKANHGAGDIRSALELVNLSALSTRAISELSGGQQQRVALARALVNQPDVLLLDEPLGALDLQLRRRLQAELRAIQQRLGTTFIYVTHDQEEALALSDRIAVMAEGAVSQLGAAREIYENPETSFVAEFVGSTNLVPCRVLGDHDGEVDVAFSNGRSCKLRQHGDARLASGASALAVLRPHHLEFTAESDALFTGSVSRSTFFGTHVRHELDLAGLEKPVIVDTGPQVELSPGDSICIGVAADHGSVVVDDREAPSAMGDAGDEQA